MIPTALPPQRSHRTNERKQGPKKPQNIPLARPIHQRPRDHKRGHDVEELVLAAAERVEDGVVERVRQRVQPVVGQAVGDDAALFGQRLVPEAVDGCSVVSNT